MLQSPTIEAVWLAMRETFVNRIVAGIDRVVERGEMRALPDSQQAARALVSMCEWHAFVALGLGHRLPATDEVDQAIDTVTDLWSRAIWGRRLTRSGPWPVAHRALLRTTTPKMMSTVTVTAVTMPRTVSTTISPTAERARRDGVGLI